eukprot:g39393.t1
MQKDLGVLVHRSLKVAEQVDKVVKKAYGMLAIIVKGIKYKDRLDRLGLFTLECKRLRGNPIQVYKIVNGIDKVESMRFFPRVEGSITRECMNRQGIEGIQIPKILLELKFLILLFLMVSLQIWASFPTLLLNSSKDDNIIFFRDV